MIDALAPGTVTFSTDGVPARERIAYWREAVCDVFVQLDCEPALHAPFAGSIATRRFGSLSMSEVASRAQKVRRSPRLISRAREDDLLVSIQLEGTGSVAQDGRQAQLQVGDFVLFDSTRPYELRFRDEFRQLVFQFQRRRLVDRLGPVESFAAIGVACGEPLGSVASDFFCSLGREGAGIGPEAAERLSGTALDLLATALAARRGTAAVPSAHRGAALARAKMVALSRLGDSELDPANLAAALGMAPRSLHRLFASENQTFMRWVLSQRLEACRRDLADPGQDHRSVSDIALGHGFTDLSHFSRAFRRRYGILPSELRASRPL